MKLGYSEAITAVGLTVGAIKSMADSADASYRCKQYNGKNTLKCHPGNGGQVELYYEYKARKRPSGSKYDRTNCAHGTIVEKDFVYGSSTVGRKHIHENGAFRTSRTQFQTIRSQFFNKSSTTNNIAPEMVGGANTINTEKFSTALQRGNTPLMMEWIKRVHYIANANVQACECEVYNLICKDDTSQSPYDLLVQDNDAYGQFTSDATKNTFISLSQGPNAETETSLTLEKCPRFRKYWGICSKSIVFLKPGEIIKNTTFFRLRYRWDQLDAESDTFIKGISHCTIVLVKGRIGHNYNPMNTDPFPPNQTPTLTGTHIDTLCETSYYVRQHAPFRNYFYLENNSWNQEGNAINTVEVVEEDGPVETIGE